MGGTQKGFGRFWRVEIFLSLPGLEPEDICSSERKMKADCFHKNIITFFVMERQSFSVMAEVNLVSILQIYLGLKTVKHSKNETKRQSRP
jgi:hypothetical protein